MKRQKYTIAGSFGRKFIRIDLTTHRLSNTLYVLLHGSYGNPYQSYKTKYDSLADSIGYSHSVGFYETSRQFSWMEKPSLSFEQYRDQSFKGKTYEDEKKDVWSAVQNIVQTTEREIDRKIDHIICLGFSLGGIWASIMQNENKKIHKIYTFGSAIRFSLDRGLELFKTFPSVQLMKSSLAKYTGELHCVRGSLDHVATSTHVKGLYTGATHASFRTLTTWDGVDHQFKTIHGISHEAELTKRIAEYVL